MLTLEKQAEIEHLTRLVSEKEIVEKQRLDVIRGKALLLQSLIWHEDIDVTSHLNS